jgi:uncharacterized protein YhaN
VKITDLEVDGFGAWSGLHLDGLSDRLTVFYGPNEAGKTTLMQFVRTMLYGFSPGRRQRYLPPLRGGRPGGSMHVTADQGRFEINRHDEASTDSYVGNLRLLGPDGSPQNERLLRTMLQGVDEPIFNNVFAIGLRELQELGSLGDSGAADLLYKLSTGMDRISLVDVLRELQSSRARLLANQDDKPSQISTLMADRDRLRTEIEQLRELTRNYAHLIADREQVEAETTRLQAEHDELEKTYRLTDIARTVRDKWQERAGIDSEMATHEGLTLLPPGALAKLDRLNSHLELARQKHAATKQDRAALLADLAKLPINEALWRQAPRIEALGEQQTWLTSLEAEVQSLTAEIAKLETQLAAEHERAGLKHGGARSHKPHEKTLHLAGRAVYDSKQQLDAAKETAAPAREKADDLANQIKTALASRQKKELTPALEKAGELVSQLRHRVQVEDRLDQLARQRAEAGEQSNRLLDRQLMPMWILGGLGGVFVFGVVMILTGLFLPTTLVGSTGWILAFLGLGGAIVAGTTRFYMEQTATEQLASCQKQITALDAQTASAKEEREHLDTELPRGGGPLLTRLAAAEKDLASLESLLALDGKRHAAEHEAGESETLVEQHRENHRLSRKRWQQALRAAGLPEDLTPKLLREVGARHGEIDDLTKQIGAKRVELGLRQRELESIVKRVTQLVVDVKLKPVNNRTADQLRQLQQELAAQDAHVAKRDQLRQRAKQLRRERNKAAHTVRRLDQHRHLLLHSCDTADEEEFRHRAVRTARVEWLRNRRETVTRDIATAIGPFGTEEVLRQHFERVHPTMLESYIDELTAHRLACQQQLRGTLERRGQLNEQLKGLAQDRRLGLKLMELGVVEQQLREAIERWQVIGVTQRLLEGIRKTYERQHQPETLKEASAYLKRLTEGHYTRVWTPLDEDTLRVDDAEGNSLPVEVLSRGTREQLFLSLRLSLIRAYGQRGVMLPTVLDDVLVNFDASRAKAAAGVLRDFAAEGFQILLFTCHEHVAKIFKNLKVATRELPNNANLNSGTISYAQPVLEEPEEIEPPKPAQIKESPIRTAVVLPTPKYVEVEPAIIYHQPEYDFVNIEPGPEPEDYDVELPRRRRVRRKRDPFENAIWHEPVEEDPALRNRLIADEAASKAWPGEYEHWLDNEDSFAGYGYANETDDIEAA